MDRRLRRDDMFHSTRHSGVNLWRADAPGPRDIPEYQTLPEHTDAQVTRHASADQEAGSSSAAAPSRRRGVFARAGRAVGRMLGASSSTQQANPGASRRRARDEAAQEVGQPRARYIAGSVMQAEETTLPRPDPTMRRTPHFEDLVLIGRAREGLEASEAKQKTLSGMVCGLIEFSAWLRQIGKPAMQGRLFTEDLTKYAWCFTRLGGNPYVISALTHLRNIESSTLGTTQIATREHRRDKVVPDADRLLIDLAFGDARVSPAAPALKISTDTGYRNALLSFGEWLALSGHPGLTSPGALHSDQMTELASQYVDAGLVYGKRLMSALARLRHFDLNGETNIKRQRNTLNIPEADQRLIERFRARANENLENALQGTGRSARDKAGYTKWDRYAVHVRSFSAWLQEQGLRNIASRLDSDFSSLEADLDRFHDNDKKKELIRQLRKALDQMNDMFSKAPEVTMARIEPNRFVNALGMFMANVSVADVARRTGANEDDLRVFLDEESATGLTQAGQAAVSLFEGRLRRAADANIALRVQSWGQAAQHTGQMPTQTPSPYHLSPMSPSGFPSFGWSDEPSGYFQHGGSVGSVQRGTDPAYEDLSPLNSAAYSGGHGFDLNTPSAEAAQQAHTDSAFDGLSSLGSAAHYSGRGLDLSTPSVEATQQGRADSAFDGLSSLGSAAHYGGRGLDLSTPSVEAAQQAGTPSEVTGPSQPRQRLSPGPMRGSLRSALSQQNLERGFASGDALNCLIDTALQLSTGVRRPDNGHTPMHDLDRTVPLWRQHLFAAGIVPQHGMIDFYSATLAGQDLAHNLGVRIQIIQWENGGVTAHPVLGQQGRLVHILHTPGHFQPLWSRNG
jgi:hypothetical protein